MGPKANEESKPAKGNPVNEKKVEEPVAGDDKQEANPFERAIKAWGEIGLDKLQKSLDDEGIQIVDNQKTSVIGRKELASRTKTFKKLPDDEKLVEIKSLLKLYQTEVDNLTNRSKYAEGCFLNLYKLLAEAPDPKPLLEASIDSVISASEASKLAAENARLNDLVSRHADYDNIKAKLMKVEMQAIENTQARVKAKEAEMRAEFDEKERAWTSKEQELNQQISDLKASFKVAQAQIQGGADSGDADSDSRSRFAELELVERDLARANSRTIDLEKRNQELRAELEKAKSGGSNEIDDKLELQNTIERLERENAVLGAKIESTRATVERGNSEMEKKVQHLERDVQLKTQETASLKEQLTKQQDYDQIKRELEILKSIEFQDDDKQDEETTTSSSASGDQKLEKRLLARNKKLNSDLTTLRVANTELNGDLDNYKSQVASLQQQMDKLTKLNSQLEKDLSTVREEGLGSESRSGRVSPTSSIIGGHGPPGPGSASTQSNSGILPIITQQRDRFRQRNAELEQELSKSFQQLTAVRKELEGVKRDNVELYEKTRYASTYKRPNMSAANEEIEDRYRAVYEEGLSPFQQFKGRETERALSNMGPFDRIMYSFTRVILANRVTRNLFMVYCALLHILVMVIVSHSATMSSSVPSMGPMTPSEDAVKAPEPVSIEHAIVP
uniref:Protein CASP n=1 Tax=Blastobotrys adeninivorans TaxID=409370 RepID=A0A060TGP8_BLAAD